MNVHTRNFFYTWCIPYLNSCFYIHISSYWIETIVRLVSISFWPSRGKVRVVVILFVSMHVSESPWPDLIHARCNVFFYSPRTDELGTDPFAHFVFIVVTTATNTGYAKTTNVVRSLVTVLQTRHKANVVWHRGGGSQRKRRIRCGRKEYSDRYICS